MSSSQGHEASLTIDPPGDERKRHVLDQFHGFPFSSDETFQRGLSGILGHESASQLPESEQSDLVLKTKVFYFNRVTGHNINLADVQAGRTTDSQPCPAQSGNECDPTFSEVDHEETRTLTFTELKYLIEQGKTDDIPNNRIIPNILNNGVPSESIAPLRKKPWEVTNRP